MKRSLRRARERHRMPGPFDWTKPEVIEKFCATTRSVRLRNRLRKMLAWFKKQSTDAGSGTPRRRRTRRAQ
jgi:hypothetical protein